MNYWSLFYFYLGWGYYIFIEKSHWLSRSFEIYLSDRYHKKHWLLYIFHCFPSVWLIYQLFSSPTPWVYKLKHSFGWAYIPRSFPSSNPCCNQIVKIFVSHVIHDNVSEHKPVFIIGVDFHSLFKKTKLCIEYGTVINLLHSSKTASLYMQFWTLWGKICSMGVTTLAISGIHMWWFKLVLVCGMVFGLVFKRFDIKMIDT